MPYRNPYAGTAYEHDPMMQQALESAGGPALSALRPGQQGTVWEALAQLAQWMGMAIPGRGGLEMVRLPGPTGTANLGTRWKNLFRADLERLAAVNSSNVSPLVNSPMWRAANQELKPLNTRALTLGRFNSTDRIKPGYGAITESTNPDEVASLLDALWGQARHGGRLP